MRNCCLFFFLLVLCLWLLIYRLRCVGSKKDQRSASGPAPELGGMSTRSRGAQGNNWITVSSLLPWKRSRAGQSARSQQILKLLAMDRLVPETDTLNIDSTCPWPLMMSSFPFVQYFVTHFRAVPCSRPLCAGTGAHTMAVHPGAHALTLYLNGLLVILAEMYRNAF